MKERRFKEDWELKTEFTDKGREKRTPVYVGPRYSLGPETTPLSRIRIHQLGSSFLYIILLLVYMLLNTPGSRCMYVLPIAICSLISAAYWVMGAFSGLRCPDRNMTSLQKGSVYDRIVHSVAGTMVIACMASLGDIIFVLTSENRSAELPGLALLLLCAVISMACYRPARDRARRIVETAPGKPKPQKKKKAPAEEKSDLAQPKGDSAGT